jgi:hypothetical protein
MLGCTVKIYIRRLNHSKPLFVGFPALIVLSTANYRFHHYE